MQTQRRLAQGRWKRVRACALAVGVALAGCMADVGVPGETNPRNAEFEAEAALLEGGQVHSSASPLPGASLAAHVPLLSMAGDTATVRVPHPMTSEHYITTVYLRDQDDIVLALYAFAQPVPGEDEASVDQAIPVFVPVRAVTAYAHCNQHGVWKSDVLFPR
jgi:desulfoferrodoxin-like iron-binding protein